MNGLKCEGCNYGIGTVVGVRMNDHRKARLSRNSAWARYSFISLPPTFTDSSSPAQPRFGLYLRHTLSQALSRLRSSSGGAGYTCATRKSNAGKAVAQWRSFLAAHFLCVFQITKSGVIRLIVVIPTSVVITTGFLCSAIILRAAWSWDNAFPGRREND